MKKLALKTGAIFVGGTLVAFTLLVNIDTYSWFNNEVRQKINISVATTEDIIKNIEILKQFNSSTAITFKKAEGLKNNPVIYFEIQGDAAEYLLHINPVKLNKDGQYKVYLEPNINIRQWWELFCKSNPIKGKLKVKYLNEYIDEEYDIELSKSYLRKRFWEEITRKAVEFTTIDDQNQAKQEITKLITHIANFVSWDNAISTGALIENETDGQSKFVKSSVDKLSLSPEQLKIINTIAPKLISHLENLHNAVDNIVSILNKEIAKNTQLQSQNTQLTSEKEALYEQVALLENEKQELTTNNEALENAKKELKERVKELERVIDKMNEEIEGVETPETSEKEEEAVEATGTQETE